jgi:protein SCO1/2
MMRGLIFLLCFTIGFFPWPANVSAHDHVHMAPMNASEPLSGTSIYNLTSVWTSKDGKPAKLESLRGQPVVVAMAYTSCKDICPMIVADMVAIEDRAKEASLKGIRFAFFSLDAAIDTPERLKAYAEDHGLDLAHWTLFHGDDKAVRELAAALGVRYRRDASGGFDHSAIITILDAEGSIVAQQPDAQINIEEMLKKITALFPPATR